MTKKQTSDRVSRIAAKVMRGLDDLPGRMPLLGRGFTVGDLRALAASCLSQDETRGKRKRKR